MLYRGLSVEQHQAGQRQTQLYFQTKSYFSRGKTTLSILICFKPCIEQQTFEGMCLLRILCKIKLLLSDSK